MQQLRKQTIYTAMEDIERLASPQAFHKIKQLNRSYRAARCIGLAGIAGGIGTLLSPTIAKSLLYVMSADSEKTAYIAGPIVLFFGLCTVWCCWDKEATLTVAHTEAININDLDAYGMERQNERIRSNSTPNS